MAHGSEIFGPEKGPGKKKPAPATRSDVRDDYTMAEDGTRKRRRSTARPATPYNPPKRKPKKYPHRPAPQPGLI